MKPPNFLSPFAYLPKGLGRSDPVRVSPSSKVKNSDTSLKAEEGVSRILLVKVHVVVFFIIVIA